MNSILYGTCSLYNEERNDMYKNVNVPYFNALTASDRFISLMKSEHNKVANSVGIAIKLDDQSYSHKHAKDSFPIIIIILLKKLTYRFHKESGTLVIFVSMFVTLILYMSIKIFYYVSGCYHRR